MYAKKVLKDIDGIAKPAYLKPSNVNSLITMAGTNNVNRYKIRALVIAENVPSVTMFKGRETMFKIGRITKDIIDRANPPIT